MVSLDEIFKTIPVLSETELRDLRQRVNVLLSLSGGAATDPGGPGQDDSTDHTDEALVLRVIGTTLEQINGTPIVHYPKNAPIRVALRQRLPDLMKYLKQIDERNRFGFLEMALGMLAGNIHERQEIPLTPIVMVQQLPRLPAIVDSHFPGYFNAGILNKVIRAYEGRGSKWPAGCHDPDSCARHQKCMYLQCRYENVDFMTIIRKE
jgi:hypothetical protein